MCQGAVNVHGQAICNCHLPCTQTEGPKPKQPEKASATCSVDELVRSAVSATAEAPNRAVKRRVRQRLHKKLGAVLGKEEFDRAMDTFHVAVEAQRLQHEEELRAQKRGPQTAPGTLLAPGMNRAKPGTNAPAFVAVPVVMVPTNGQPGRAAVPMCANMAGQTGPTPSWNMPGAVLCAVQDVKRVQERVGIPQMPFKTGPLPQKAGPAGFNFCGQPNGFYAAPQAEDSDSDKSIGQGVTFQRARSEGNETMAQENLPVERTFIQFSSSGDSSKRSRSQ